MGSERGDYRWKRFRMAVWALALGVTVATPLVLAVFTRNWGPID